MHFLHPIVEENEPEASMQDAPSAPEPPEPSPQSLTSKASQKRKKTTLDYFEKKEKPRRGSSNVDTALNTVAQNVQIKLTKAYDETNKRQTSTNRSPRRSSFSSPTVSRRQWSSTPRTSGHRSSSTPRCTRRRSSSRGSRGQGISAPNSSRKRGSSTQRAVRRQSSSLRGSSQGTSTPKSSRKQDSITPGGSPGSLDQPIASSQLENSQRLNSQSLEILRRSTSTMENGESTSSGQSISTPVDSLSPPKDLGLRSHSKSSADEDAEDEDAEDDHFMSSTEEEEEIPNPKPRQPKRRQPKKITARRRGSMGFPDEDEKPKARRRQKRRAVQDDLAIPQWVINVLLDIEDATKHELTVE